MLDPLVERERPRRSGARARRSPAPRARPRSIACASSGDGLERLDGLAQPRGDLRGRARPGRAARRRVRLRELGASAVATRSPVPARPTNVRACPPLLLGQREHLEEDVGRRHPGRVEPLRLRWRPRPRRPRSSPRRPAPPPPGRPRPRTPRRARWNGLGHAVREHLRARRAHEPRPGLDHLARVRGTADAGHPLAAERRLERDRRRRAVRRHEALRQRDDPRALGHARG